MRESFKTSLDEALGITPEGTILQRSQVTEGSSTSSLRDAVPGTQQPLHGEAASLCRKRTLHWGSARLLHCQGMQAFVGGVVLVSVAQSPSTLQSEVCHACTMDRQTNSSRPYNLLFSGLPCTYLA